MERLEKWPPKICGGFENSAGIKASCYTYIERFSKAAGKRASLLKKMI